MPGPFEDPFSPAQIQSTLFPFRPGRRGRCQGVLALFSRRVDPTPPFLFYPVVFSLFRSCPFFLFDPGRGLSFFLIAFFVFFSFSFFRSRRFIFPFSIFVAFCFFSISSCLFLFFPIRSSRYTSEGSLATPSYAPSTPPTTSETRW